MNKSQNDIREKNKSNRTLLMTEFRIILEPYYVSFEKEYGKHINLAK